MLRFEGDRDFTLPPAAVFAKLADCRFLVTCIPDLETLNEVQPDYAALVLRPGLAFMRGTLNLTIRIEDVDAPTTARVLLSTKGIGSSSAVEATLTFAGQGEGTKVHWVADIKELGGLLKMVPAGLIQGAAQKVINDVWAKISSSLANE